MSDRITITMSSRDAALIQEAVDLARRNTPNEDKVRWTALYNLGDALTIQLAAVQPLAVEGAA